MILIPIAILSILTMLGFLYRHCPTLPNILITEPTFSRHDVKNISLNVEISFHPTFSKSVGTRKMLELCLIMG